MTASFTLDGDRIRIADAILVYLERTHGSPSVVPRGRIPRPYGSLPLAVHTLEDSRGQIGLAGNADHALRTSGQEVSARIVLAPAMPREAVWLGFQAIERNSPVRVRIRIDEPEQIDAITGGPWADGLLDDPRNFLTCPPETSLVGRPVVGGRRLFGSTPRERLTVFVWRSPPTGVSVHFLPPAEFFRITGRKPDAIEAATAYTGRRLP